MQAVIRNASVHTRRQIHSFPCIRGRLLHFAGVSSEASPQKLDEFLSWLRKKTGHEISAALSIGTSPYGRSLFASECIKGGDCILKIPYYAHLTPDKVFPDVTSLIVDDVGKISRLAVVIMAEQGLGKDSDWYPYVSSLPCTGTMHNTIFWTDEELIMIQQSSIYHDTINTKSFLAKEFSLIMPALKQYSEIFQNIKLENFMHAYALVVSRAWGTSNGVSLVPFADFLNHEGSSEAVLLSDDDKEISEVIADRSYSVGEEVLISYGKFPNSTLMLDYGFTVSHNIYDQVQFFMDVPLYDPLYKMKVELLHKHSKEPIANGDIFNSTKHSFIIKEVKTSCRKGRGIPQTLRAYARVLTVVTCEELTSLANEASQGDGRIARRPLKDIRREIQAHNILLSEFDHMIKCRDVKIEELE